MDRGKSFSDRVILGLMLAAVVALAVPVVAAGVTAAADAASPAKTAKKKKKRARTRTVIKTKTVTKTVTVTSAAPSTGQLIGTFRLTPGSYAGGKPGGTWFRMILPGGRDSGPYFTNPDSTAGDRSYTLLSPGTDGGLNTGAFQAPPTPAFDDNGNALAARIIKPQKFAGVNFSVSTAQKEAQTGADVLAPVINASADGKLTGDLRAFAAQWNRQSFNQGSPKPDGSKPGITSPVTGTFDAKTKQFTLEWTSSIVGGPFNGFTGQWHLEGTFVSCGT